MPWYYAGPDAKPVGPLSLEELHARRWSGDVKPETYIIEHAGQQGTAGLAWRRYSEVFPPAPSAPTAVPLPQIPPAPPVPGMSVAPIPAPAITPPTVTPNPLFPSATPLPGQTSVFAPTHRPDPYYRPQSKPTNAFCGWGLGLAAAGLLFSAPCFGIVFAVPAFFLCLAGLSQLQKKQQEGRGMAITGLVFSVLAVAIASIVFFEVFLPMVKNHEMTVTEQSSTDSE